MFCSIKELSGEYRLLCITMAQFSKINPEFLCFFYTKYYFHNYKKIHVTSGNGKVKSMACIIWRGGRPLAPLCHCSQLCCPKYVFLMWNFVYSIQNESFLVSELKLFTLLSTLLESQSSELMFFGVVRVIKNTDIQFAKSNIKKMGKCNIINIKLKYFHS